jgi:hypothetical protein
MHTHKYAEGTPPSIFVSSKTSKTTSPIKRSSKAYTYTHTHADTLLTQTHAYIHTHIFSSISILGKTSKTSSLPSPQSQWRERNVYRDI